MVGRTEEANALRNVSVMMIMMMMMRDATKKKEVGETKEQFQVTTRLTSISKTYL